MLEVIIMQAMKEKFIKLNETKLIELLNSFLVNADPSEKDTGSILEWVMDYCKIHNLRPDHLEFLKSEYGLSIDD